MYGQTVTRRDRVNQHNGRSASSARKRNGPGPQISIRARGVDEPHHEAGHTTAPDHMPAPTKKTACIQRGVHTRPVSGAWLAPAGLNTSSDAR